MVAIATFVVSGVYETKPLLEEEDEEGCLLLSFVAGTMPMLTSTVMALQLAVLLLLAPHRGPIMCIAPT